MNRLCAPAAAICLAVLPGCKPPGAPDATPPATQAVAAVKIALLLPLTGAQATFGEDAIGGARLAADEINAAGGVLGRPIELEIRDTGSDLAAVAPLVEAAAAQPDVAAIVGEIASGRTIEAARAAAGLGIALVAPAATSPDVTAPGEWVFRTCYAEPFQGSAMARFALSIGATRAALLADAGDPYSQGLAQSFREAFRAAGGEITADVTIPEGTTDFRPLLEPIKAATPDVIFLPVYFGEAAAVIVQAREVGIETPFLGGDGWDAPEFLRTGGEAVENCYAANHFSAGRPTDLVQEFSKRFEAAKGMPPPPLAALAYDAVRLTATAIQAAGTTDRRAVRDAIAATREFPGVTGTISFDASRNTAKPAIILRVEGGRFTYLETVEP